MPETQEDADLSTSLLALGITVLKMLTVFIGV